MDYNTNNTTDPSLLQNQNNHSNNFSIDQNQSSNNDIDFINNDIDLSGIEIIDTSKGGVVGEDVLTLNAISLVCRSCGFRYEGRVLIENCPRCGGKDFIDG